MKITCSRAALDRAISTVGRAISGRSTTPIVSHVAGIVSSGSLRLTATNLENWIELSIPVDGDEGDFALPYDRLSQIVAAFTGESVVMSRVADSNKVGIICDRANCQILSLPYEEFPGIPDVESDASFTITGKEFGAALRHVMFAVGTDQTQPIMTGVYTIVNSDGVQFVASDRQRVAIRDVTAESIKGSATAIIPAKPLSEALRTAAADATVAVSISNHLARFEVRTKDESPIVVVSRLIEGGFPQAYKRIVPTEHTICMTVVVSDMASALKRIAVFAKDDANRVTIRTDGVTLHMSAQSGVAGTIEDEVDIGGSGGNITFRVSAAQLSQYLASVGSEDVSIEMTTPTKPILFKSIGGDAADGYVYVQGALQVAA